MEQPIASSKIRVSKQAANFLKERQLNLRDMEKESRK